ncbi:molybdopterin-dependent oxidoreductase [Oceanicella actignis]|uniref:molybdopterin-dependent oxidoreductase n=1 Tax=Oceanicella actignis TaxID=1189325 RepID=UPI0011E84AE3|nr:molybdopterin-dependent oxidoreductase [Oceanicella actignis]TYO88254.1 biotin/methionine sulfoxide reductase [Oceanicella actignis]
MHEVEKVFTSHWGAFRLRARGGRLTQALPFAADPDPSDIARAVPAAVHHRSRVARPSVRRSWLEGRPGARAGRLRGREGFVELPWDEALDLAAQEIDRVRRDHGPEAIYGGSYGWGSAGRFHHAQSQVHRFLSCIGGYVSSFASYSTGAAQAIIPHVLGMEFLRLTWEEQNAWPMIAENTRTMVMFGGVNRKNAQVSMGGVTRHEVGGWLERLSRAGARLVNVGPQRADAPEFCEWLPLAPGTDVALMLALAWTLEDEGLTDRAFLARCATGYERLRDYLTGAADGQPKTPEWAAPICGVAPERIRALARRMASTRTLITVAWSLQRARHGEQPYWMAVALAAMLGQIGLPGGGVGFGYGAIGGVGAAIRRLGGMTLPQPPNPVRDFIPVARIADMLLDPGGRFEFNGRVMRYPDIRLVYWCGGNPFHHHQDLGRLSRAWTRPETIIVHEPWWTATARRADIVFPATTPYEREDIGRAGADPFLFHMPAMIPPVAEARNDYDIFAALAARLGEAERFTEGRDAAGWIAHLYERFRQQAAAEGVEVPTLDELRARGWVELPIAGAEHARVPFARFRADPEAAPLGTPSGRIELFSERIAAFGYDDCPGHPAWLAPDDDLPAERYRLKLLSPQPADKLHSQLECALADAPGARPQTVRLHPSELHARGLRDGALARVFNDRGATLARVRADPGVVPGVAVLPTGAWFDPGPDGTDRQGNPNALTRDLGTSRLGQGSSAHTARVEIAPLETAAGG